MVNSLLQCRASCRLADQARRQLKRSSKFEDLSDGEYRPSQLVERFENLYSQVRLDTMDGLDEMDLFSELEDSDTIKAKLLFSVVVVSLQHNCCGQLIAVSGSH